MLEIAFAQLRLMTTIIFGQPFSLTALDQLIDAAHETQQEFGALSPEAVELLSGPTIDEEERRDLHLRRFRAQAVRAAHDTVYYGRLFEQIGLAPARLKHRDISLIPITQKEALEANPDTFVRRIAQPVMRMAGGVYFSLYELRLIAALAAIELLLKGEVGVDEVIQINYPASALPFTLGLGGAYARLGALIQPVGQVEPDYALAMLAQKQRLPGKKSRPSILLAYPSYLDELVDVGLRLGYNPDHFGLERIITGGELVTEGLKIRCQYLFGQVQFKEYYASTAILPLIGAGRPEGGLQFEPLQGLVEVINPDTSTPAQPGEIGTVVVTPFSAYRDTTLVLRYDTQDMVRLPVEATPPGTTPSILGKFHHSARHELGWTFPREIQEALEAVEAVRLPVRYGFWAIPSGVAVEVLVTKNTPKVRGQIEQSLLEHAVPVRELHLVEERTQLQRPLPLRCDGHQGEQFQLPIKADRSLNQTNRLGLSPRNYREKVI